MWRYIYRNVYFFIRFWKKKYYFVTGVKGNDNLFDLFDYSYMWDFWLVVLGGVIVIFILRGGMNIVYFRL